MKRRRTTILKTTMLLSFGLILLFILPQSVSAEGVVELNWVSQFGRSTYNQPYGVEVDSTGNIYISGDIWVGSYPNYRDIFITKYDSEGNLLSLETCRHHLSKPRFLPSYTKLRLLALHL